MRLENIETESLQFRKSCRISRHLSQILLCHCSLPPPQSTHTPTIVASASFRISQHARLRLLSSLPQFLGFRCPCCCGFQLLCCVAVASLNHPPLPLLHCPSIFGQKNLSLERKTLFYYGKSFLQTAFV